VQNVQNHSLLASQPVAHIRNFVVGMRLHRSFILARERGVRKTAAHPGLREIAPPDGAFYIYADVRRFTANSLEFCETILRDTGVATAPGIDFDPVEGRHFIRFSFAVATAEVVDAIARLRPWFAAAATRRPG
jgi:aspartate/methionine/tyrosine aminotransferase